MRVIGIDTQIPHRSVAYRVVKTSAGNQVIVWQDQKEETNGPGDGALPGQWYDAQNQFQLN